MTDDAYLATELLNSPKLAPYIAGRLTERALLLAQDAAAAIIKALKQNKYPVLVVSKLLANSSANLLGLSPTNDRADTDSISFPAQSFASGSQWQIRLPQRIKLENLPTYISSASLREAWKIYTGSDDSRSDSLQSEELFAQLNDVWKKRSLLRKLLRRCVRADSSAIERLAWLRLFRTSIVPRTVIEVLFRNCPTPRAPKQKPVLPLTSLFIPLDNAQESTLSDTVYVPETLVEIAWDQAIQPPKAAVPFPTKYIESDGLDAWIALCLVWQAAWDNPLRLTNDGALHKRDGERLREVLGLVPNLPVGRSLAPERWCELACALGLVAVDTSARLLRVRSLADFTRRSWGESLVDCWHAWLLLQCCRNSSDTTQYESGEHPGPISAEPRSLLSCLAATALLMSLPESKGLSLATIQEVVSYQNPHRTHLGTNDLAGKERTEDWLEEWLGLLWMLGLVHWSEEHHLIRLSPLGRWLLGLSSQWQEPQKQPCLIGQPNLEVIAFRPALRPSAIAMLTLLAHCKATYPALVLQIDSASIHRAAQFGYAPETLVSWLSEHATREIPESARELITTWAQQQQRINVYPQATLFEFDTPGDLQEAMRDGLPGSPLSDRLFLLDDSTDVDFRQFRITANIPYHQPLNPLVSVLEDGMTLEVKLHQANLLLECELQQVADLVETDTVRQIRRYQITPESIARSRQQGWTVLRWQQWFLKRCGQAPSPAVHLLLTAPRSEFLFGQLYILETPSETMAEGLTQWPETARLILRRLGPTTLAVRPDAQEAISALLEKLGAKLHPVTDGSVTVPRPEGEVIGRDP